jgi:CheY-specific phosphatase CheX
MSTTAAMEDVARRYGLEPIPASVLRLTQLVASQDADLEQIGKVIQQDKGLTSVLLRQANPGIATPANYEITNVEEALMRNGMGSVLLLAMSDPLRHAVEKTFATMVGIPVQPASPTVKWTNQHILGDVAFTGKAFGFIRLRLLPQAAQLFAARLLGLEPSQLTQTSEIDDGTGELVNIIVGNFKSNLCDAGLECKLAAPKILRTNDFEVEQVRGSLTERLAFQASEFALLIDATVNPWRG